MIRSNDPLPRQPGLLQVCQQVRAEAMSIYLKENRFKFTVIGFDAANMNRWSTLSPAHARSKYKLHPGALGPSPWNWKNLLAWLEQCYEGGPHCMVSTEGYNELPSLEWKIAARMWEITSDLREQGQSWEQIKVSLEISRQMAAVYAPNVWAKE